MPLNNPNAAGALLRPRLRILSAGVEIPQCYALSLVSSNRFQADRFTLSFAATASGVGSMAWWASQSNLPVDLQVGFVAPGSAEGSQSWTSLQTGKVDRPSLDMDSRTISVEGRDNSALFIDARVQPQQAVNVNQTSSEIVAGLVAAQGLTASITATPTPVGRFWSSDHTAASFSQFHSVRTQWDLIVTLARLEGYNAYFQGSAFHFEPITDPAADPYVWQYATDAQGRTAGNVSGLRMSREATVSKGVQVIVRSWNAKQARSIIKYAPSAKVAKEGTQEHHYNKPNLTDQQAQDYANARYAEIKRHEMTISANLFGDMILTPRCMVSLVGTGTAFDQTYYPQSVTRNISVGGGFMMQAVCRNHDDAEG